MKQKKIKLNTLLLFALGLTGLQAQNTLYVKEQNGTQTSFALNDVRKLTFQTGNMVVYKTDGNAEMYSISNIRYLNFTDLSGGVSHVKMQEALSLALFPNPVMDELTINYQSSCNHTIQIDLVDMQGTVVYRETVNRTIGINQVNINVTGFPKGLYLCRMNDGKSIRTCKFLKD